MAHVQLPTKLKKKDAEIAKRQAVARRRIEIGRELVAIGLHPIKDVHLISASFH
ncbi:TPA: hypothetical protein ACOL2D_004125 [Vibrio parahaemolyticus]